jgi:hypothetical protein
VLLKSKKFFTLAVWDFFSEVSWAERVREGRARERASRPVGRAGEWADGNSMLNSRRPCCRMCRHSISFRDRTDLL